MIVIYTQNNTIIKNSLDAAKDDIVRLYGEKLGAEAYTRLKNERIGDSYRKSGGPLIKVVTKEQAKTIFEKESSIGMILG